MFYQRRQTAQARRRGLSDRSPGQISHQTSLPRLFQPFRYWSYERDRWFESISLHRRVSKPSVPLDVGYWSGGKAEHEQLPVRRRQPRDARYPGGEKFSSPDVLYSKWSQRRLIRPASVHPEPLLRAVADPRLQGRIYPGHQRGGVGTRLSAARQGQRREDWSFG